MHYEKIHTTTKDGFDITVSVAPEYTHPKDLFDDTVDDITEICRKIDLGILDWFIVRVDASKNGILLASDYLGGNLYNNARDFIKESGGYYEEMVFNAITEAAEVINKLGA